MGSASLLRSTWCRTPMLSLSWDWASCFFAQLGMAPAPASPLSLVLPNPAEELWSWGWTSISINRSHQWVLGSEQDLRCL